MQLFQVGIKEKASSAKVTSYHYIQYLEETQERLQARLDAGDIYFFEVIV
jgi:hypothetical protein